VNFISMSEFSSTIATGRFLLESYRAEVAGESTPLNDREIVALTTACDINVPLLTSLTNEYGPRRGWKLCGPDATLRSRFMRASSGIPLLEENDKSLDDVLGIRVGFRSNDKEHDFICLWRNWCEELVIVDGTANLQFFDDDDPRRSLYLKSYQSDELWSRAAYDLGLTRENWDMPDLDIWGEGYPTDWVGYQDHEALLVDDQVFQNEITGPSGRVYNVTDYWGDRLVRVASQTFADLPPGVVDTLDNVWRASP
jgi:hypothetical protein